MNNFKLKGIRIISGIIFFMSFLFVQTSSNSEALTEIIFLQESFEDTNFAARGWYDSTGGVISNTEFAEGNGSFECTFLQGQSGCAGGSPARHKFNETEIIYLSYYVKYSPNWQGSNRGYHPHEFLIMTNVDSDWIGPAGTHLTLYVEQNEGTPIIALQDLLNVDTGCLVLNHLPIDYCDDYTFTENRSVAACNGIAGDLDQRDCFSFGSGYYSSRSWRANGIYFQDTPGLYYKNDWHYVEAMFELNSIQEGVGVPDGKIRYWYDGRLLITSDNILFRTGQHPDMKLDQFLVAPYMAPTDGSGSPIEQTFWIDNLTIANYRVNSAPARSNPSPTENLSSGTTQTIISLSTDENATCKYSTTPGTDYSLMQNTFSTTNSTNHSTLITGLSDGNTYNYNVRCQDLSGNSNSDDFLISFEVRDSSSDDANDDNNGDDTNDDGDNSGGGNCFISTSAFKNGFFGSEEKIFKGILQQIGK